MVSDSHVRRSLGGIVGMLGAVTIIFAAFNGLFAAAFEPVHLVYFAVDGLIGLATMVAAILFIRRLSVGYYLMLVTLLAGIAIRVAPLVVGNMPPIFWTVVYIGVLLYALLSYSLIDDASGERQAEAVDPHGSVRR